MSPTRSTVPASQPASQSAHSATRARTRTRPPARVAFVGAGPGDPGLLTTRAQEYLAGAAVVVIDQVSREDFVRRFAAPDVEIVDAGYGEHGQPLTHASRAKLVVRAARSPRAAESGADTPVVRLMDGDPGTFGGLAVEALACRKAGIDFEIVPGVSATLAVAAYAGIPLTGGSTQNVHLVGPGSKVDWSASVAPEVTVVVLGPPEAIAAGLQALCLAGRAEDTTVALTLRGSTFAQRTQVVALSEASTAVLEFDDSAPVLAVVGSPVELREQLSWFETKPLFGWDVLVPRTREQAGSMTRRLEMYGATSHVVPTISVEPPRTPQQMERSIKGLVTGRYEWVGFTSVNAVRAVRERLVELGLDARAFAGLQIAAVGGATADALREWGIEPDLIPQGEQSASGLLADWPPYDRLLDPINRVLLPRADIATDTLVAGLGTMGWEVDDVTAYRTVRAAPPEAAIRDAIKSGRFDAVCFTSSSTVRNLIGIAGKPHPSTVVACIGPHTAKTAEEHGLRVDVLASEPSAQSLVDALADYGVGLTSTAVESGEDASRPSARKATARRRAR